MDEKYQIAFDLISHAGIAKSAALEAIDVAIEGDYDLAERKIAEGRVEMAAAHDSQFSLITKEANQEPIDLNIVLVHAFDHLTMAIMSLDMAERFVAALKAR